MSKVSLYLNFPRTTEEAFLFYRSVFGGEFMGDIHRMGDVPHAEGTPTLAEADENLVMHIALPIFDSITLMGTDAPESMGFTVRQGNNIYINLEPDSRTQVDELFAKLSEGGTADTEPADMFWGAYYGSCTDRFGIQWMFNFDPQTVTN